MVYKLLIVDDEEIEREGMANYIEWDKFEVKVVETAWNGIDGLEKIRKTLPDIVLTDIKMPEMNGIELIHQAKQEFPEIEFIVLSGYGEFEFTSKAMEEGVRHYLLKPCDEIQIQEVLDKVKKEIGRKREWNQREKEYQTKVKCLLPHAKEQMFRDVLLDEYPAERNYQILFEESKKSEEKCKILAFGSDTEFDYLEYFVLENVLTELLGEDKVLLCTYIRNQVLFLLTDLETEIVKEAIDKLQVEYEHISQHFLLGVLSSLGTFENIKKMFEEVQGFLKIGIAEHKKKFLDCSMVLEGQQWKCDAIDYKRLNQAKNVEQILYEIYFAFKKMELKKYTFEQKEEICNWVLKMLYGERLEKADDKKQDESDCGKEECQDLMEQFAKKIVICKKIEDRKGDGKHIQKILYAMYRYLDEPQMSIHFLAKQVLYMNEDYFGRVFQKNLKKKFSVYLMEVRIELAKRFLEYDSDLKLFQISEMVGYPADGQYFSKVFKKMTGMTPSEYRESLKSGEYK